LEIKKIGGGVMSRLGVFPIPGEFKSEDKWFRYFDRKQALVLVICGIMDYRAVMTAAAKGMLVPALILMLFLTLAAMGIVMIRLPVDALFLSGGGLTIDTLIFRVLYRKLHREIYTKNYGMKSGEEL
jgi:hypothetical protein